MIIHDFQTLMRPILEYLADGQQNRRAIRLLLLRRDGDTRWSSGRTRYGMPGITGGRLV